MMSTFTISDYTINFDGAPCKMGGMGGVATLPQYRRKGGIRGCFTSALPAMYEEGYEFSYLYPFSTAYYRKFGYENCVQKYHVTLLNSMLNPPEVEGFFAMTEQNKPMTEDIQAVDRVWEQRYNMMVVHTDEDYKWTTEVDPAAKQNFTYVYLDMNGTPKAYTTFHKEDQPDGRNLVCSRFCFADMEGYYGLLHLFKSLASDHMLTKFTIPATPAMQYMMAEWSMGAARWSIQPAGMVRVVNVKRVLEKARYQGSGRLVLEIQDKQIKENNQRYALAFQDGKATRVEETLDDADVAMTIPTFSALISGVCDMADTCYLTGITIHNDSPCLSQVFYRKPMMISDYF